MSASLNKKYLRALEERDTALRQVRELQAQLSGVQSQLDAANARDAEARQAAAKPGVILLMIDTLRWDYLSCYGANKGLTPNIDTGGYLITKDNLGLIEELSGTYR